MKNISEEDYIAKEEFLLDLEYSLITNYIEIRKNKKVTQQELSEKSEVIRQTINRVENLITSPQIRTMIKLLEPLGYTLGIVPLEKGEKEKWEDIYH